MNELKELGLKYKTDKATSHNYTEIYHKAFSPLRNAKLKFLEIGSGDIGASHKMWREYFPNAEIYCIDPFCFPCQEAGLYGTLESIGVKAFKGNQLSRPDLNKFIETYGGEFDIIMDDGAHLPDAIQISLATLFRALKQGGVYMVEDLECARSRNERIEECNRSVVAARNNETAKILNHLHVKEIILEESLGHWGTHGEWISSVLTEAEKKYLTDNIETYKLFDDPAYGRNNLCIIKKK